MGDGIRVVEGELTPVNSRMVFDFEMGKFVEKNVAKKIGWEKNDLPIETEIASGGARAETG